MSKDFSPPATTPEHLGTALAEDGYAVLAPQGLAQWVDMPVEMLREMLTADRQETAAESDASKGGSAVS